MNSFTLALIFFAMLLFFAWNMGMNRKKASNDFTVKDGAWLAYAIVMGCVGWWMLRAGP